MCYTISDVHLIMYALCDKKWFEKISEAKKDALFSSIFFQLYLFLAKFYFDMCFDNLIKFCGLHYYYKTQSIWNQPIIYTSNTSML
jgi:hypothetical protein